MSKNKDILEITVGSGAGGKRIDKYLTEVLSDKSRSYIQRLIKNDSVFIDGRIADKNHRVRVGEILQIKDLDKFEMPSKIEPQEISLNILYEDDYLLAISKPPGISVHPSSGNYKNTLVNALLFYFKDNMADFTDQIRPGIVHRLDRDTSGVLVIAKSQKIQRKLSELFKERNVKKCYIALVLGLFSEKNGEIQLPVGRSRMDRKKMSVSIDRGRDAITGFTVKDSFKNNCSLLHVFPETGRTHQIRVHFSYIDHPVIGDKIYGNKDSDIICRDMGLEHHFLHAFRLSFFHPVTNKLLELEASLPEDLLKGLEFLSKFKI